MASMKKRVCVLVLGDLGRSPRMSNHAMSLAKEGYNVDLLGYKGSQPSIALRENRFVSFEYLYPLPSIFESLPTLFLYVMKTLWQTLTLFVALCFISYNFVLVQNPPSLPALGVVWLVCRIRGSGFVVDWHNYGTSIFALTSGKGHPLLSLHHWFEFFFGGKADVAFCVTKAMSSDLASRGITGVKTLYDRPPQHYKEQEVSCKHVLFGRLAQLYPEFQAESGGNVFTVEDDVGEVSMRKDRPVLLFSSTSWTEDEDFSILLEALQRYENACEVDENLPDILCVVTGRGPQKEFYRTLVKKMVTKHVKICMPWLEMEDYATLVGSADLGVCLHYSSSGLDLPMKVVDMFGCCLPVCAVSFMCLPELLIHGENGMVFDTSAELFQQLQELLSGFPICVSDDLQRMRENLRRSFALRRWGEHWKDIALPLLESF